MIQKIGVGITCGLLFIFFLESEGFRDFCKLGALGYICYILYEIYKVLK